MTAIRITGGACGVGAGDYEDGVFTMPDGTSRGVETLSALEGPEAAGSSTHWSGNLVRGLQGAMASAEKLPRPLSVAASAFGFGLGAFETRPPIVALTIAFMDGTDAVIETDADLVALMARDRAVVQGAIARRASPPAMVAPRDADLDRTTTAMFEYEKRNGRLRRVSGKESARKDPVDG